MKKGQVLEGTIEKVEFPNKGVVTVAEEGKSVIVKNGIPGQKVKFCVNKFKRGNAEGRLLEVLEKSPLETRKPVCSIFPVCGGCMYQTMSYEAQMDMKAEQVKNILNEAVNGEYLFEGVIKGEIIREKRGDSGFGYDPVFKPEGYEQTFAELGNDIKNKISHRALAVQKLCEFLQS